MITQSLGLKNLFSKGDAILLKALDEVMYHPVIDDVPLGIIKELENLNLIAVKNNRLTLTRTGKKALRAGGLKNFYNGVETKKHYQFSQSIPVYFFFLIVLIIVIYLLYQLFFIDVAWDSLSFLDD